MLYDSVHQKIFSLPESYLVYPAHDYQGIVLKCIFDYVYVQNFAKSSFV